jgi:tetraacyldisaccharide 4'-kinase
MKPSVTLLPFSAIYAGVTRARLAAYQRGWFAVSRLRVPVISVGNLTTGGTGKTPLVEWICRKIALASGEVVGNATEVETKRNVCVLTRGYGRKDPNTQVVVSDGNRLLAGEEEAGDEPFLLARNLLGIAAVVANPNRVAAGKWAIENLNTGVFVLDDGFQHLRLARDLDIVTIDATNPWGSGRLLPYGRLRETTSGLARADCVVITRADQAEDLAAVRSEVERLVGSIPILMSRMISSGFRRLDGSSADVESICSRPVAAFCGVGNPESFFEQARRAGCAPIFRRAFADHHNYKQLELDALINEAKAAGAESLVTTAKDAIRLANLKLELPCYVLEIEISIDDEDRLIELVNSLV